MLFNLLVIFCLYERLQFTSLTYTYIHFFIYWDWLFPKIHFSFSVPKRNRGYLYIRIQLFTKYDILRCGLKVKPRFCITGYVSLQDMIQYNYNLDVTITNGDQFCLQHKYSYLCVLLFYHTFESSSSS